MKRIFKPFLIASVAAVSFTACQRNAQDVTAPSADIAESTLAKINALGFSTENARKVENGYLVEGDIVLTEENLSSGATSPTLLIANEEQYRTTNLVTRLPRTVTVSVTNLPTVYSTATDAALARYNNLSNTRIKFVRATAGATGDIDIFGFDQGPSGGYITLGSSGFPTSAGDPYNQIKMNTNPQAYGTNPNVDYVTSVLQHEMGHCIGFRHTDYYDRSYSCGGHKSNERAGSVGAVLIPGTPSQANAESFMLACSNGGNRTFNANDLVAMDYLY